MEPVIEVPLLEIFLMGLEDAFEAVALFRRAKK